MLVSFLFPVLMTDLTMAWDLMGTVKTWNPKQYGMLARRVKVMWERNFEF